MTNVYLICVEQLRIGLISSLKWLEAAIYGVAQLENEIYVLRFSDPEILIFDALTFKRKKFTAIIPFNDNILRPLDLVASRREHCCFISDVAMESHFTIWRLTPNMGEPVVVEWLTIKPTDTYYACSKLSVMSLNTREDDKDMVVIMQKIGNERQLDFYENVADKGKHFRTVSLSKNRSESLGDMLDLQHATQAKNGDVIVSEGWVFTGVNHLVHQLSLDDGRYVWTYGNGPKHLPLRGPAYLAVDTHGIIYVADYKNNRLLAMNLSRSECVEIRTWDKDYPVRLNIVEFVENENNVTRLYVGLHNAKCVEIYTITRNVEIQDTITFSLNNSDYVPIPSVADIIQPVRYCVK